MSTFVSTVDTLKLNCGATGRTSLLQVLFMNTCVLKGKHLILIMSPTYL